MKLSLEAVAEFNQIHSYDENEIVIRPKHQTGLETFKTGFLLSADSILTDPPLSKNIEQLSHADCLLLQNLAPEIIIFIIDQNLTPELQRAVRPLIKAAIGVEFMTLGPACRTFNLLVSEQRHVLLVASF